jgi:hypothetical protein
MGRHRTRATPPPCCRKKGFGLPQAVPEIATRETGTREENDQQEKLLVHSSRLAIPASLSQRQTLAAHSKAVLTTLRSVHPSGFRIKESPFTRWC